MIVKDPRRFTKRVKRSRRWRRPANLLLTTTLIFQIVMGGLIGILLATAIIGHFMPNNPVYLTIKQFLTNLIG
jgi:hypothetical protein